MNAMNIGGAEKSSMEFPRAQNTPPLCNLTLYFLILLNKALILFFYHLSMGNKCTLQRTLIQAYVAYDQPTPRLKRLRNFAA